MLSKSSGLLLIDHSQSVAKIATTLSKQILDKNFLDEHIRKIEICALIHDIGKCINTFQSYIKSKINCEEHDEEIEDQKILHHEASWAIASCLFDKRDYETMLNAIYWHHAKPMYDKDSNVNDYLSTILNEISDEELHEAYKQLQLLIPEHLIPLEKFMENVNKNKESEEKTPPYYSPIYKSSANRFNVIYRSILISSDRISSKLSKNENKRLLNDENYIISLLKQEKNIFSANIPDFYDKSRVDYQLTIAEECSKNNTTVVKAPAGFGKTLIGILWSIKRNQKLLWVCPRNIVVESVYDSILTEINNIGLNQKISVELFLTGTRKKCTNPEIKEFQSDIVITNIDNFLAPISRNRFGEWSVEILQRDVVFDEYHEFVGESALFGGFLEIMKLRHLAINCKTILLSATPSIIHTFWDSPTKKTTVLPNSDEHYPAAHSKTYRIEFIGENDLKNEKNSLIMTNSIFNSQMKKKELETDMLIHSDFLEEDKQEILSTLFESYKKNSTTNNKPSVSSAPIIQASCDISFKNINKSSLSPEADTQTIGRCNRWGEYDDSIIRFFSIEREKRSELKAISTLYDSDLYKTWISFKQKEVALLEFNVSLNDWYKIYNKFNSSFQEKIKAFIQTKYEQSILSLSKIEPVKYSIGKKTKISSLAINTSTTLRTNGESVFVTYRKHDNPDEWVAPFSVTIPKNMFREEYFSEDKNEHFLKNFQRTIKTFIQTQRFNYNKSIKSNANPSRVFKWAFKETSPYVAFNKEYSKEFGLAKTSIYNN